MADIRGTRLTQSSLGIRADNSIHRRRLSSWEGCRYFYLEERLGCRERLRGTETELFFINTSNIIHTHDNYLKTSHVKQGQPFKALSLNGLNISFKGIVGATCRTPLRGRSQSQLTRSSGKSAPSTVTGRDRSKRRLLLAGLTLSFLFDMIS